MKNLSKIIFLFLSFTLVQLTWGNEDKETTEPSITEQIRTLAKEQPETVLKEVSYILGYDTMVKVFQEYNDLENIVLDNDELEKGFMDALKNKQSKHSPEHSNIVYEAYLLIKKAEFRKVVSKKSVINKEAGKKFVESYKKQSDVKIDDSGILYKIIKEGTGEKPSLDSLVKVNYEARFVDGTVFDSTDNYGESAELPVKYVMPGWQIMLPKMKVGSKWEIVVPPKLAYGSGNARGLVGPESTLIFEIELLSVEVYKEEQAAPSKK